MPWTPITSPSAPWTPLPGGRDDWLNPLLTELLTESGLFLLAENDGFLATEAVSTIPSPWVPL